MVIQLSNKSLVILNSIHKIEPYIITDKNDVDRIGHKVFDIHLLYGIGITHDTEEFKSAKDLWEKYYELLDAIKAESSFFTFIKP